MLVPALIALSNTTLAFAARRMKIGLIVVLEIHNDPLALVHVEKWPRCFRIKDTASTKPTDTFMINYYDNDPNVPHSF